MNDEKKNIIPPPSGSPPKRRKHDNCHKYVSGEISAASSFQGVCEVLETKVDDNDPDSKLYLCYFHKKKVVGKQFFLNPIRNHSTEFLNYTKKQTDDNGGVDMMVTVKDYKNGRDDTFMAEKHKTYPIEPFNFFVGRPATSEDFVEDAITWATRVGNFVKVYMNDVCEERGQYDVSSFHVQLANDSGKKCFNDLFHENEDLWEAINLIWNLDDREAMSEFLGCENCMRICFGDSRNSGNLSFHKKHMWKLFREFHVTRTDSENV